MNFKETIKLIYQKKWLVFWLAVLGAVLFFDLMVIQEPQYKASSKILVVQKQVAGQDIYTISKSAQYLTRILKEGIYSDVFFEDVLKSSYQVETTDFSTQLKERRKEWQKSVKVSAVRDLGVIEIDIFYPQREKTEQITLAIIDTLEKNHQFYHGSGQNVEVKILDNPLVSQNPITIRLWLGTIFGALLGFLISLLWIFKKGLKTDFLEEAFNKEASFLDGKSDFSI
ncbi:MAG: hypothetical protein ABH889_00715 [Candidatus Portnoybacteria bacterium]